MARETDRQAWERGYRDGKVGRDEKPPKRIFDARSSDRYAYKDGQTKGQKDAKK